MKDKRAKQLKNRRRMEKEAEKNAKIQKVLKSVNTYYEQHNMPLISNKKAKMVYHKLKEVDDDVITKSAVLSLLCTLYVLYKHYDYSIDDLMKYGKRLQNFIKLVVNHGRPIKKIIEEIEVDYDINFVEECKDIPRLTNELAMKLSPQEIRWKSTSDNYTYFLTLNVYILIMDFDWETNQIKKFINENKEVYLQILNNIEYRFTLQDILKKECKLYVNLDTGCIVNIEKGDYIS